MENRNRNIIEMILALWELYLESALEGLNLQTKDKDGQWIPLEDYMNTLGQQVKQNKKP